MEDRMDVSFDETESLEGEQTRLLSFEELERPPILLNEMAVQQGAAQLVYTREPDGMDDGEFFEMAKAELHTNGMDSALLKDIAHLDAYNKDALEIVIGDIARDQTMSDQDKVDNLNAARDLYNQDDEFVSKHFKEFVFQVASDPLFNEDGVDAYNSEQSLQRLSESANFFNFAEEYFLENAKTPESVTWSFVADFSELFTPVAFKGFIHSVYEKYTGKESLLDTAPSEHMNFLTRDILDETDIEVKKQKTQKLIDAILQEDVLAQDYNFLAQMGLFHMILDPDYDTSTVNLDAVIEDVIFGLDLVLVTSLAGGAILKMPRFLGMLNMINSKAAQRASAAFVKTGEAKLLGKDVDFAIGESHLMKQEGARPHVAPEQVSDTVKRVDEIFAKMRNKYHSHVDHAQDKMQIMAKYYGITNPRIESSTVRKLPNGDMRYRMIMGATETRGFASMGEVMDYINTFGKNIKLSDITIYNRGVGRLNPADDEFKIKRQMRAKDPKKVEALRAQTGDFFIGVKYDEAAPPPKNKIASFDNMTTIPLPKAQLRKYIRFVQPGEATFAHNDWLAISGLSDQMEAYRHNYDLALKHFDSLKPEQQGKVVAYLERGADRNDPIEFTRAQLIQGYGSLPPLSHAEADAYANFRLMNNFIYDTMDLALSNKLRENNFKTWNMEKEGTPDTLTLFGVRVSPDENALRDVPEVMDAGTGDVIPVTKDIKNEVATGRRLLYRLSSAQIKRDDPTSAHNALQYALFDESSESLLRDIPLKGVMKKHDGYVYTQWTDTYYVEKIDPEARLNGRAPKNETEAQKLRAVEGAGATRTDASAVKDRLTSQLSREELDRGVEYRIRVGKEIAKDWRPQNAAMKAAELNNLLSRRRSSKPLVRIDGDSSGILPVSEALQRSINSAGYVSVKRPFIDQLKEDWMTAFGRDFVMENNEGKVYPFSVDDILMPSTDRKDPSYTRYNDAVAAYKWIEYYEGMDDPVNTAWRSSINWVADKIDSRIILSPESKRALIGFLERRKQRSPLDWMRHAAFLNFMTFNPGRQLLVQGAQHLTLFPLAPKYIGTGQAWYDTWGLLDGAHLKAELGDGFKKSPEALSWAKARGMTIDEFSDEVDGWLDSGLPFSISSNQFMENLSFDITRRMESSDFKGSAMRSTGNFLKWISNGVNKGFEWGEIGNLAVTWNIVRHLESKKGGKTDWSQVGKMSRAMAWNMDKGGKMGYQDGLLRSVTQFLSIAHKGMFHTAAAFGSRYGTKTLDSYNMKLLGKEVRGSAAVVGVQIGMWGGAGLGLATLVHGVLDWMEQDADIPIPPEVRESLAYGIGTVTYNRMLEAVTGEATDLDLAGSFSPFSGWGLVQELWGHIIADEDVNIKALFMGPSAVVWDRYGTAANNIAALLGSHLDADEVFLKTLDELAKGASSGYSNFRRTALANGVLSHLDKKGEAVVPVNQVESFLKNFLGINTQSYLRTYEISMDYDERVKEYSEWANDIIDTAVLLFDPQREYSDVEFYDEVIAFATRELALLADERDPHSGMTIRAEVGSRVYAGLKERWTADSKATKLVERVLQSGHYTVEESISMVYQLYPREQADVLADKLRQYYNSQPKNGFDKEAEED